MTISNGTGEFTSFINDQTTFTLKPLLGNRTCLISSDQPSNLPNGELAENKCQGGKCTFKLEAGRKESTAVGDAFRNYVESIGGESKGVVSGCGYNNYNPPKLPDKMNFAFCGLFDNKMGDTFEACFAQASLEPDHGSRANHWLMASKDLKINCANNNELTLNNVHPVFTPPCHVGQTLRSENNVMEFKVSFAKVDANFSVCATVDKCPSDPKDPLHLSDLKVHAQGTFAGLTEKVSAHWRNCTVDNAKHTLTCPDQGDDTSLHPNQLSLKQLGMPAGAALEMSGTYINKTDGSLDFTNVRPNSIALADTPAHTPEISVTQSGNPHLTYVTGNPCA